MTPCRTRAASFLVALSLAAAATPAAGADTTEPFAIGVSDVEVYLARDGLGLGAADQSVAGEVVLGVGLSERLSVHVATGIASSSVLTSGSREHRFGIFANVRDGESLDLDLMFDMGTTSGDEETTCLRTGLELNWDAAPDMGSWGLYGRAGATFYGREAGGRPVRLTDLDLGLGVYRTVAPGRQLLLEYDAVRCDRRVGDGRWRHGAVALGWNAVLSGTMELISQVSVGIPESGEPAGLGFALGFIGTLAGP